MVFTFLKDQSQKCTRHRSVKADRLGGYSHDPGEKQKQERGCRNGEEWFEKYMREKIYRGGIKEEYQLPDKVKTKVSKWHHQQKQKRYREQQIKKSFLRT